MPDCPRDQRPQVRCDADGGCMTAILIVVLLMCYGYAHTWATSVHHELRAIRVELQKGGKR